LGAALVVGVLAVHGATIEDNNTWMTFLITGPVGEGRHETNPWHYLFDSPLKFADNSQKFAQGTWRGGLGYALNPKWSVWAGYSYTYTDQPYTKTPVREHRGFQQVLWIDRAGDFTLSTRQRLEERFPDVGHDVGLRSRHLFRVTHPLGFFKPLSWALWDEVFFNLNETDYGAKTGLEQNRAFAGFGWKWSEVARSEFGYLHHFVQRPGGDDRLNHVLSISLALTFK
jgi:hypothetical protein